MSSNSYRYFWDPETGNTRTSRPFRQTTVECVGGATQTVTLPGEDTLQFLTAENGQRFATIVTPKVRAVARNQFDCQDLEGGQLENQPTGSTSCYGDHWDERLYYPESLSGVISPNEVFLSPLSKYPNFIFEKLDIHLLLNFMLQALYLNSMFSFLLQRLPCLKTPDGIQQTIPRAEFHPGDTEPDVILRANHALT